MVRECCLSWLSPYLSFKNQVHLFNKDRPAQFEKAWGNFETSKYSNIVGSGKELRLFFCNKITGRKSARQSVTFSRHLTSFVVSLKLEGVTSFFCIEYIIKTDKCDSQKRLWDSFRKICGLLEESEGNSSIFFVDF